MLLKRDKLLLSFLQHELISSKYGIASKDLPRNLNEALRSEKPIIQAIALIVEGVEKTPKASENELRNTVTNYLQQNAL